MTMLNNLSQEREGRNETREERKKVGKEFSLMGLEIDFFLGTGEVGIGSGTEITYVLNVYQEA